MCFSLDKQLHKMAEWIYGWRDGCSLAVFLEFSLYEPSNDINFY